MHTATQTQTQAQIPPQMQEIDEELIKDVGDTYEFPDFAVIAKYTQAKVGQMMDEFVAKALIDAPPVDFPKLNLADKREVLIAIIKKMTGTDDEDDTTVDTVNAPTVPDTNDSIQETDTLVEAMEKAIAADESGEIAAAAPKSKGGKGKGSKAKSNTEADPAYTPVADDPIAKFAARIEKITDRVHLETILHGLNEQNEENEFKRGGVLAQFQTKPDLWKTGGHESFTKFVENACNLSYRKAMYCISIYQKLLTLDLKWKVFDGIGWSKIIELLRIIDKANVAEWVEKAKFVSTLTLKHHIDAALKEGSADAPVAPSESKTMAFKCHPDQRAIIDAALEKAKAEVNTEVNTVALEAIAQSYMGSGISFTDWKPALSYARKHSDDPGAFASDVLELVQKLCPELEFGDIEITIK